MASGWTVVSYDQLGCGLSDKPDDASLWTLPRYVTELEEVVDQLASAREKRRDDVPDQPHLEPGPRLHQR